MKTITIEIEEAQARLFLELLIDGSKFWTRYGITSVRIEAAKAIKSQIENELHKLDWTPSYSPEHF